MTEYLVDDRLVSGGAVELQQIFPNRQHTLMRSVFLGEALLLLGSAVVDIHNVHGAITNVGQHIHTTEVTQMVCNGGKALGKNIRSNKIDVIVHTPEIEIYAVTLK